MRKLGNHPPQARNRQRQSLIPTPGRIARSGIFLFKN